jgi:hypothetical protein
VPGDGISLSIANNAGGAGAVLSGGGSVNTDVNGNATFTATSLNLAGTGYTLAATDSSATPLTTTSLAFNIGAAAANRISFGTQPSNAVAGASIAPAIVAHVQDAFGNAVSGDGVSLSLANNPGGAGSVLSGGGQVNTDNDGNAAFADVSLNLVGSGYTVTATDSSASPLVATSNGFNITTAAPSTITFTTQPLVGSNQTAGVAFAVIAHVVDQFGNPLQGDNVTLGFGNNAGSATLTAGVNPVSTDSSGNATFGAVSLNRVGTGYTLTAADGTAPSATGNAFNVVAAAPSSISFSVEPSNAIAGVANNPAIVTTVQDAFGNAIAGDNVSLSIASGSPGALLTVTNPEATNSSGNATFGDAVIATAGTYTLTATDGSATPLTATSTSFTIGAAAPAGLTFTTQPSNTVAGTAISPAVHVTLVDTFGNVVIGDVADSVTLTLASGTDPSFTGGGPVTVSGGVATFPAIKLTVAASGYTLSAATTAGVFTALSNPFAVTPGPVTSLGFNPDPPSNTVAGVAIPGTETVTEYDQFHNVVTTDNTSTISLVADGPAAFIPSPAPATVSGGVAAFSDDLFLDTAGSYTLAASTSASALVSADSQMFTVAAATGNSLTFTPAPGNIQSGQSLGNVTVTEYDNFGNQVLSDNSTSVTLTAGSCGGTALGTGVLTGGVVTFNASLQFNTAASNITLTAVAAGDPAPKSAAATFNVGANSDVVFYNGFASCSP